MPDPNHTAGRRPRPRRRLGADPVRRALLRTGGVMCTIALSGVLGLAVWALLPVALGAHATVVLTGSMAPAIMPGDLVVSGPADPAEVRPGRVIWFDDPARPGRTLVHRVVEVAQDGALVTRGDANTADDPFPVRTDAVLGLPRLRVPVVGLPMVWARQQQWVPVGVTALALLAVARGSVSTLPGPRVRPGAAP